MKVKRLLKQFMIWLHIKPKYDLNKYDTIDWKIRHHIKGYFDGYEHYDEKWTLQKVYTHQLGITDIKVKDNKSNIIITITLLRPGLLIGKAGCEIDNLTKKLTEWMNKPVTIKIIESRLWG
jgi:ribosomal protein S3